MTEETVIVDGELNCRVIEPLNLNIANTKTDDRIRHVGSGFNRGSLLY